MTQVSPYFNEFFRHEMRTRGAHLHCLRMASYVRAKSQILTASLTVLSVDCWVSHWRPGFWLDRHRWCCACQASCLRVARHFICSKSILHWSSWSKQTGWIYCGVSTLRTTWSLKPRLRFDLFDRCARYKFSSFIHSFIQKTLRIRRRVEGSTNLPSNWQHLLSLYVNKKELFIFLVIHTMRMQHLPDGKQLVTT